MEEFYNPEDGKFIVYSTQSCGLGDRLFGLIGTYLLSILNNYHFRIKLDDDITYADVFQSPIPWWSDDWKLQPLKRGRLNIESNLADNLGLFTDKTISESYPNSDCLYLYSNQNFIPYLFQNDNYKEKLSNMGLTVENAFKLTLESLLQFENEFIPNYEFLKNKLRENGKKVVGMHVRTNRFWGDVPEISNYTIDQFHRAVDVALNDDINLFVCSDDEEVIFKLKTRYGNDRVISIPGQSTHYSKNNKKKMYDVLKTFFEIWLLSECDYIIASYWSNFSRVAVLKSMKKPLIVELDIHENPKQPTRDWVNSFGNVDIENTDILRKHFNIPNPVDGLRRADITELMTKI